MTYIDAHNHLQDRRLKDALGACITRCEELGVNHCVVNGTHPDDWDSVHNLASKHPWMRAAYGVHPWYVESLPEGWLTNLRDRLRSPATLVGEIGIDYWRVAINRELQESVFLSQLGIARELNRPTTIHGLKAWERLLELLRAHGAPKVGFLLHSYSGPAHLVGPFVELGAYFSCAPSFFSPSRHKKLQVFKHVPLARLLPETDAPDQGPPAVLDPYALVARDGAPLNHPGSIVVVYRGLANLLGLGESELADQFQENFFTLFG